MYKQKLCLGIIEGFEMTYAEQVRLMNKVGFEAFFIDDCNRHAPVAELVALSKELGMEIPSYHAPFNKSDDLWNPDEIGEIGKRELLECVELCSRFEIPVMVTHAFIGYEDDFVSVEAGIERYGEVAKRASELGVRLALENTEGDEYLAILFNALKSEKSVGFCWDTGHELCYNYGKDMTALYGDKLICTHLNDNLGIRDFNGKRTWHDDLHLLPFDGITDWDSVAERLAKAEYTAPLSFELSITSKPERHENDGYAAMSPEAYFTEAYKRACRVAALKLKYEGEK